MKQDVICDGVDVHCILRPLRRHTKLRASRCRVDALATDEERQRCSDFAALPLCDLGTRRLRVVLLGFAQTPIVHEETASWMTGSLHERPG